MNKTILLIDDIEQYREATARVLNMAGYKVLLAEDGQQGIDIAETKASDLILCCINKTEFDAYSILYLIGKKNELATIPFIFIDRQGKSLDIRKAFSLGVDDCLQAPFSNIDLLNSIECQLKKRELRKAYFTQSYKNSYSFSYGDGKHEIKKTIESRKTKRVKAKFPIYSEGDPVSGIYLLVEGRVKSVKLNEDGRELVTAIYGPDEYFAVHDLLMNECYTETVEAIDDSTVCLLPRDTIIDLINRYPDLAKDFMKILSAEIIQKKEQLLQLAYHSVRKRMAETLLSLGRKSKNSNLSKMLVDIPREDLAGIAGIAIETACRTITDFQNEGILKKEGLKIHLVNVPKLERMRN